MKYVLMILAFCCVLQVNAQPPENREKMEKIKSMKVEYITSKLDLTPGEAEKFWPVYNEFNEKIMNLERARHQKMRQSRNQELTDSQVNELINLNFTTDQKILDVRKQYDKEFKQVLSIQKVGKLYVAEEEFKRDLLRQLRNGPPPGPKE
jgi:hypothetical protein